MCDSFVLFPLDDYDVHLRKDLRAARVMMHWPVDEESKKTIF